jgi:hypothetical protein
MNNEKFAGPDKTDQREARSLRVAVVLFATEEDFPSRTGAASATSLPTPSCWNRANT